MANKGTREKLDIELEAPADFTSPEVLYQDSINTTRKYHPLDDITMIEKAYGTADEAHREQKRKSGGPYIIHPLCVVIILTDPEMDKEIIAAGLLHDAVEDTTMTLEQLIGEFGSEAFLLVDGVTKLTQLNWDKDRVEIQTDNLHKMFSTMAEDIRAIIIKLADHLRNMRIGQYRRLERQKEKAREAAEIYAPIADRLGISKIKIELDDLSLRLFQPDVYYDLVEKVALRKNTRKAFVQEIVDEVKSHMEDAGIEPTVGGRAKHFFSIYKKMVNQNETLDQIYDLFTMRIVVETMKDCYAALGATHEMYKPISGHFRDYIVISKQNMYQPLHTTLVGSNGQPFETQIRTYEMHRAAECDIAAYWKYKESRSGQMAVGGAEARLSWLRQILEWQRDTNDPKEFLSTIKGDLDLFLDSVYCFIPSGDVKTLPSGSTPIDFVYCIHSTVGNKMVGARVNGKLASIEYVIQNGDQLEITAPQNSKGSSRDWLGIVKSTQAKNKINQWFKSQMKEDNIVRGRDRIERCCEAKGTSWSDTGKFEFMEKVTNRYAYKDWDFVLASIGREGLKEDQVINKMAEEREKKLKWETTDADVLSGITDIAGRVDEASVRKPKSSTMIKGIHDLAVRFPKCRNPVPGDEIVGFVIRGRGVSIHRTDYVNIIGPPEDERSRMIDAEWQMTGGASNNEQYSTEIEIFANNRIDMLADISRVFTEKQTDITSMNVGTSKQGKVTIIITFDTHGTDELNRLTDKIRQIEGVLDIERTTGQL